MPPNAPVFADVATRLRLSHAATSDLPTAAIEATAIKSALRLPSTRPLDYRWDRSRGIIFNNALRATCTDRAWKAEGTVSLITRPATTRSYASRHIGSRKNVDERSSSYVDNVHRVGGFSPSSNRQTAESKATIDQLRKQVEEKAKEIQELLDAGREKDESAVSLSNDLKALQQSLEKTETAHKKERDSFQRTVRQEREAHALALHDLENAHADKLQQAEEVRKREVQDVRDEAENKMESLRQSAADKILTNAPIIEKARREGEELAKKRFDRELHAQSREFTEQRARDLERQAEQDEQEAERKKQIKTLQAKIEDLDTRLRNERQQHAADTGKLRLSHRLELWKARAHTDEIDGERAAALDRIQRLTAERNDMRELLEGRKARAKKDRAQYIGYRELFRNMFDHTYEGLASGNSIRDALTLEGHLWEKSAKAFQRADELLLMREQPKYDPLRRSINEFLELRSRQAHAAAEQMRGLTNQLLEARNDLSLQGHATRMVTRNLHFTNEPSDVGAVSTVHYMALVRPFQQRQNECEKQIRDVTSQIETLESQSSRVPAQLQKQLEDLHRCHMITKHHLRYAEAFRRREAYEALLSSSIEERVTFARLQELQDRLINLSTILRESEAESIATGRSLSSLQTENLVVRKKLEDLEARTRERVIVQLDLGELKSTEISEADAEIEKRIAGQKSREQRLLAVVAGERMSDAKTLRQRKAQRLKGNISVDHLRASLESDTHYRTDTRRRTDKRRRPTSQISTRHAARSAVPSPRGRLAYYTSRIQHLQAKKIQVRGKAQRKIMNEEIEKLQVKRREATIEQSTLIGSASGRPSASASKSMPTDGSGASGASPMSSASTPGLTFKPSSPMQAPREVRFSQWSTLHDALGADSDAATKSAPKHTSLDVVLKARTSATVGTTTGQASEREHGQKVSSGIPMGTPVDQSSRQNANSRANDKTRASGSQTTSDVPRLSTDEQRDNMPPQRSSAADGISDSVELSPPSSLSSYVPTDSDEASDSEPAEETASKPEPHTILDYQIPQKVYRDAVKASCKSNAAYWSHQLYKSLDGKSPAVYYCKTLETAERQCKLFLGEPVLGFDLEWEMHSNLYRSPVKKSISLIQIAAEDKICLIHVALFSGDKIEQLLPPSLKTILEDADVAKAGVNVSNDALRMRHCLGVDMQGIFELSHMYRLVKTPDQVSFKMVNMAEQVRNTLLLPLKKGKVRVSAWSKSLDSEQCAYAAADAYAGFRLFYQLDNLRKDLRPTPPRPAFYETKQPIVLGDGTAVERAQVKPKAVAKKIANAAQDEEEDDEFFDALEGLPDTYELDKVVSPVDRQSGELKAVKEDTMSIDEADPDSLSALRDVLEETVLKGGHASADLGTTETKSAGRSCNGAAAAAAAASTSKTPKPSPHVLVASPETLLADMWVQSLPSRNPRVGAASLRAYHLWHHQSHNLDAVAGLCRQPPLALTTVSSYIMTAIKEEEMPYDKERLKEAFAHLPKSVWHIYDKWVRELGLNS
ncbi:hypothetical protein BST61_g9700 [Cercospora zeina]